MEKRLQGSSAFITGGGRGIGRAAALALAEAGAAVAVCSRTNEEVKTVRDEIEARGGRALATVADVTDGVALEAAVAKAEADLGPLDLLLCSAGVGGPQERAWEVEPRHWWRVQEVNVLGVLHAIRAAVPGMVRRDRGRIIHVASLVGARPSPRVSAYACSKSALLRMNDCLAAELEGTGVVSLAISPGLVRTVMTEPLARNWDIPDSAWTPITKSTELIVRLAAGDGDKLSGHFIHVEDDLDALMDQLDVIRERGWYGLRVTRGLTGERPE